MEVSPHSASHPGHVLRVPYIRKLNEFYGRKMGGRPREFRVLRDGIAKIIQTGTDRLTLYPISHSVLVFRLLEFAGMKAEVSQLGYLRPRSSRSYTE